jgi:hypothetical protein
VGSLLDENVGMRDSRNSGIEIRARKAIGLLHQLRQERRRYLR